MGPGLAHFFFKKKAGYRFGTSGGVCKGRGCIK